MRAAGRREPGGRWIDAGRERRRARLVGVAEGELRVRLEVRGELLVRVVHDGVDDRELTGDGHKDGLEPIAQQREGPRVELLAQVGVGVGEEHVAREGRLEPANGLLDQLAARGIDRRHLS